MSKKKQKNFSEKENTKNPKYFSLGSKAFKKGDLSNPFSLDTTRGKEWERGFNAAYFENLERLKNENFG